MGRIRRAIQRHGVGGTLRLGLAAVRHRWRSARRYVHDRRFDLRHGVDTRGIVRHAPASESSPWAHAVEYQGVWGSAFESAMQAPSIGDHSRWTFVDLGCGKGKALLLATAYRFERIVGVELADDLAATAERNVARFTARHPGLPPVEVVRGDAASYELPGRPLLIYLHNPFDDVILARVLHQLESSLQANPRPVRVVYHTPVHRHVLDAASFVDELDVIPGGVVYGAG
jgi:SAM-dependent methyltransferase